MNDTHTARVCNRRACVAASVLHDVRLRASRVAGIPYGVMPHQFDDPLHNVYASRGDILFVVVFCDLSSVMSSFLAAWSMFSLFLGVFPSSAWTCPVPRLARNYTCCAWSRKTNYRASGFVRAFGHVQESTRHLTATFSRLCARVDRLRNGMKQWYRVLMVPYMQPTPCGFVRVYPVRALTVFLPLSADDTGIGGPGVRNPFFALGGDLPAASSAAREAGGPPRRPGGEL